MCGINAVIGGTRNKVDTMFKASSRRGKIQHIDEVAGAFVSFDWLPITDKNAPAQPFTYNGNIVYLNGFISNYKELAKKYGYNLQTNCDTEFLVRFLSEFKMDRIQELNGFFAVLWFEGSDWISFCDRYGIKKLYQYIDGCSGKVFIASEIKSILAVCPEIQFDERSIEEFEYSLGVMNKNSLYHKIKRVGQIPFNIPEKQFIPYKEAKKKLKELFVKACERNKTELSDCVFLSGGIDSGMIAKQMRPRFSFSMDYQDEKFSEIENIKLNSTGKHLTMICNKELFNEYSEKLVECLDDPKVGSSFTNMALTELASQFCVVMYSGAGGDEFFGGYPHRKNKPINEVIKRTGKESERAYCCNHFEYDLKFLRGVLNVEDSIAGFYTMETRYPLLDNDLIDFALSLPDEYLENKRILKDISGLDDKVLKGKKRGFSNPYLSNDEWSQFIINRLKKKHERFI